MTKQTKTKGDITMSTEFTPPCVICKKVHKRLNTKNYVYHASKGIVCLRHPGVEKWYNEMLESDKQNDS